MDPSRAEHAPIDAASSAHRRENIFILAIIALQLCITVPLGLWLNVWIDEIYTLHTTSRGLGYALKHAREFELHPPIYYILLWTWRQIDASIPFARMFSATFVAITLWMVHLNVRRWFPKLPTPWVIIPLAFNPWMIYAATELRMYCLIVLVCSLVFYFFHRGFVEQPPRFSWQIGYAVIAVISVYTFYYIGFLLPGGAAALLIWRRWREFRNYMILMFICGLLVLPQLLLSIQDSEVYTVTVTEKPTIVRAIELSSARVLDMVAGFFVFSEPVRLAIFAVLVLVLVGGALVRIRHWDLQSSAIPIMAAFVGLGYFALIWLIVSDHVFFRHFVAALIPLHLAFVAVADRFGDRRKAVLAGVMSFLLVCGVASGILRFSPLAKVGDYRDVANYIEANEQPGETIFVAVSHAEYPLRVYYDGENEIRPIPVRDELVTYDVALWTFKDRQHVEDIFSDVSPGDAIWMFTDRGVDANFAGVSLNFIYLEDFLSEEFTLESEEDDFYFATVRKLRRN